MIMVLLFVPTGCSDEEESPNYELALSEYSICIATSGGRAVIAVTASEPWGAVPDDDEPWCTLELSETRLTVICSANNTGSYRSAKISISTAHKTKSLDVAQTVY
jgi:hypothetical protein